VETAEKNSQAKPETEARASPQATSAPAADSQPVFIEPDLEFIRELGKQGGETLKNCMQCGTCSATCSISPDPRPFPRKEIAWAAWGMRDRLLADPDVWLCFQCNDCSMICPRGVRPGDVLAAVRRESVRHYATPSFLGALVNQGKYFPLKLAVPTVILGLAALLRGTIAGALGIEPDTSTRIVYSYSSLFPHWLINSVFLFFSVLVVIGAFAGVFRFWRALKDAGIRDGTATPVKGLAPSIGATLKSILLHDKFAVCTANQWRHLSHMGVLYGFLALSVVTLWIITSGINPLIKGDFVYPYGFWNPWKLLANVGGLAILIGCVLLIYDRLKDIKQIGAGTYFDWSFILTLLVVVVSGFFTEILHYFRMEPHRHAIYFIHLVFVFALLMYFPYSKFAHLLYRATAMVYAEHIGRKGPRSELESSDERQEDIQ
jgi:quinone-modifying oxidoreductase subunit QmoC